MLNFYDRPFVYFSPKPNRSLQFIAGIYNKIYYLRSHVHRVVSVECEKSEMVQRLASDKKNRLLFLINHPTHSDVQVIVEAYRQARVASNYMSTYDLFYRQSKLNRWIMGKFGTFSIDRESFNSQPIKESINTLLQGKYHLTIFSEGRPNLQNDLLTAFQDGGAFVSLSTQKTMDARELGERVLIIPTAIKLTHAEDCRNTILDMLINLYDFLGITPDPNMKIEESIETAGLALMEYGLNSFGFKPSKGRTPLERQQYAGEMIVKSLEKEMNITADGEIPLDERVKAIRREIHKLMLTRNCGSRVWAQARIRAHKIMLAMKILSYPLLYLIENPTLDRCGEIIERLIEDKNSKSVAPYSKRRALVEFGEAFSISEIDPIGEMGRNELLAETTAFSQKAVQDMLNRINMTNLYPGGELF